MKKVKDFILSLILPRRMAKYRNMHFILALLIYLVGMFLAIGSQFMVSEKYVKQEMGRTEFQESLSGYYNSDKPNKTFRMQNLEITSDNGVSLDPSSDDLTSYDKLITIKYTGDSSSLDLYMAFMDSLDEEFLNKEDPSKDETTIIKKCLQNLIDYQTNAKADTLMFYFGKDTLYYHRGKLTNTYTLESSLKDVLQEFTTISDYNTKCSLALSNLRRLTKVDLVTFINKMNEALTLGLPKYKSVVESNNVDYYIDSYFKKYGIYHKVMDDENNKFVDLTVVIVPKLNLKSENKEDWRLTYFDYEGYSKQERQKDTIYILCVFTSERFFYVYDLAQKNESGVYKQLDYKNASIFETSSTINDKVYYLPNSADEIEYNEYGEFDTTKWTRKVGQDDKFNIEDFNTNEELRSRINMGDLLTIKPANRHLPNFYEAVYTTHSRSYSYNDFISDEFSIKLLYGNLNIFLQKAVDRMIAIDAANYELVYAMLAFGIFIIFPLILTLVVWLMSRKLVMKRYRQYYAIGSIAYAITGLVSFIVGFFVSFDRLALILMFIQSWYFIFVTFRINTDPAYNTPTDDSNTPNNNDNPEPVKFKPVSEHQSSQIG